MDSSGSSMDNFPKGSNVRTGYRVAVHKKVTLFHSSIMSFVKSVRISKSIGIFMYVNDHDQETEMVF